ncbi:hypothetical protein PHMEG_00035638 [Phytophthora megakarya]|uniref:Uncharacterized protein n=1 Tax=Phytophthora megakarya TaxID=4795 RepID=A0A225UPU2_9STRA|nr:hypothetical protein PHMEG_00035638 [Phytophthora megakarya]
MCIVLDKFAMHLEFRESSKGLYHLRILFLATLGISRTLSAKLALVLDKYCSKRGTDFTHQAAPCTTRDLRAMCTTILAYATTAEDYKDCALLNFLWYLLGKSSDIIGLMNNLAADYPGGCLFIIFKTLQPMEHLCFTTLSISYRVHYILSLST